MKAKTLLKNTILQIISLLILLQLVSCESNDNPIIQGSSNLKPKSKVLLELFTNTSCAFCIYPGLYLNDIDSLKGITINDTNVIIIRCHTTLFPNDPFHNFNPFANLARQNYYNAGLYNPVAYLKGVQMPGFNASIWTNLINQELAKTNPISIDIICTFDTLSRNGNLNITVGQLSGSQLSDLRLFIMVTEGHLPYNAPNGETMFENVLRDILSSENGESFSILPGQSISFYKDFTLRNGINPYNSQIIAFVQNYSTQAVYGVEKAEVIK
ncbi:MAG: Omp28-related outer membrane protein [Ignavibacteria bacterium]